MADAYTVLWTNDVCRALQREGFAGERLTVLFGGRHQSLPSFRRAGLRPGDAVFPVRVHRKRLWLLGRLEVSRVFDYGTVGEHLATEDCARLLRWRPIKGGCTSEVLLGPPGTPLTFDHAVPGDVLSRLTYRSRRGERGVKYVQDGLLLRSVSLEGVYRLAPHSAEAFRRLLAEAHAGGASTPPWAGASSPVPQLGGTGRGLDVGSGG